MARAGSGPSLTTKDAKEHKGRPEDSGLRVTSCPWWFKIFPDYANRHLRCSVRPLVIHPLLNEVRPENDPEVVPFAVDQIKECGAVQFHKILQIEHGPQLTIGG